MSLVSSFFGDTVYISTPCLSACVDNNNLKKGKCYLLGDCRDREISNIDGQRCWERQRTRVPSCDVTRHLVPGPFKRQLRRSCCGCCSVRRQVSPVEESACHTDCRLVWWAGSFLIIIIIITKNPHSRLHRPLCYLFTVCILCLLCIRCRLRRDWFSQLHFHFPIKYEHKKFPFMTVNFDRELDIHISLKVN